MKSATIATFITGAIDGVVIYTLKRLYDERGWLTELFRNDELGREFHPAMAYVSFTRPGMQRGPHSHAEQADLFCFIGPSNFNLRMWDDRADSPSFGNMMSIVLGESDPRAVIVPKGVVHGYKNIGDVDGMVINCPNRLYMGEGKSEPVDEIRHEDDPETIFRMDWQMLPTSLVLIEE